MQKVHIEVNYDFMVLRLAEDQVRLKHCEGKLGKPYMPVFNGYKL